MFGDLFSLLAVMGHRKRSKVDISSESNSDNDCSLSSDNHDGDVHLSNHDESSDNHVSSFVMFIYHGSLFFISIIFLNLLVFLLRTNILRKMILCFI